MPVEFLTDEEAAVFGRYADLARHGMTARAQALGRHGDPRKLGMLVAIVAYLEATDAGGELTLGQVWESIDDAVPRRQFRESVDAVVDFVPPPGLDAYAETRARVAERTALVTPFLKILTEVIMNAALDKLRAQGYLILDEDVARTPRSPASTSTWSATTPSRYPTSARRASARCATPTHQTMTTAERGSWAALRQRGSGPGQPNSPW